MLDRHLQHLEHRHRSRSVGCLVRCQSSRFYIIGLQSALWKEHWYLHGNLEEEEKKNLFQGNLTN